MKKNKMILITDAEIELIKLQSLLSVHRSIKDQILNKLIITQLKKKLMR